MSGESVKVVESSNSAVADHADEDEGTEAGPEVDPDIDATSELEECITDIAHAITCLYEFSITIWNPAPSDRLEKCSKIHVSHFEMFDIQHAQHKFPYADGHLRERLGKANTKRRQLLKYHEGRYGEIPGQYDTCGSSVTTTSLTEDVDRGLVQEAQDVTDHTLVQSPHTIASKCKTQTTVSTYVPWQLDITDTASESSHSETSFSTSIEDGLDSAQGLVINVPPPPNPKSAFSGKPFPCPYCYTIISVSGPRPWKSEPQFIY